FGPAVDDWSRAIDLDDGQYHSTLRLKRASTLLNLKDHSPAGADAQAVAESSKATSKDLYKAACVRADCAQIAANDAPAPESYAARAVLVLRRAAGKGYKDLAQIKKDSDLDALRTREDLRTLSREFEARPRESDIPVPKAGRTDSKRLVSMR